MVEIMQKLQGLQEMLKWPRHSRMCATIKKRQTKIAFKNVATRSMIRFTLDVVYVFVARWLDEHF